jgi:manganese oxidase
MNRARRAFLQGTAALSAGLIAVAKVLAAGQEHEMQDMPGMQHGRPKTSPAKSRAAKPAMSVPVQTPDVPDLPHEMDRDVKVFRLRAEPVRREIAPGKVLDLWGFNGSAPGPTIQVTEGDRVRIIVENRLPEPTSMHWHGLEIPNNMDGAPGISQDPIPPGGQFAYEFTLHQNGTFFYHPHQAMQEMFGMIGAFIMHPKRPYEPGVDQDFAIILQEFAVLPNNTVPNSMNMEFNWLTFNGKVGPAATPLVVRHGDRVRIRWMNLGMDHHPVHLHGHTFYVTGSEAGRQPQSLWGPTNTVLVGVAEAVDFEFVANNPGDWMVHCHLPHHMMNQMSSTVGPMTRRPGMPMGVSMENGMGMLDGTPGVPLGEDYGPSLGRGMGAGSTNDQPVANTPFSPAKAAQAISGMQREQMQHEHKQMSEVPQNANQIAGFPQDAYMEGPMMAMDDMVSKPETYGLRPGRSGFMQGMMTFVRVLEPDLYEKIMTLRREQKPMQNMPMEHQHHG